jgi:hypothetical protein
VFECVYEIMSGSKIGLYQCEKVCVRESKCVYVCVCVYVRSCV